MREADLTRWLASPETKVLLAYLHQRRAETVRTFLAGAPVDPVMQGRAAALFELEGLLSSPAEQVKQQLENVLREHKTT